jgi:hypothetical protein
MIERFYGSDPEYFIYSEYKQTASGLIPDIIPPASLITDFNVPFTLSKNNKRILIEKPEYRWIEDGAAIELNYKNPIKNPSDFYSIAYGAFRDLNYLLDGISYKVTNKRFKVSTELLGYFDLNKYWKSRDKSFTDCVRFGCDPDIFPKYYLFSGFEKENCKIIDASKHEYRYAGGHIHIQNMSSNSDVYLDNIELAPIIFDFIVGTTNVMINRDFKIINQEKARLKYYGRPGRIRIQKYSPRKNGIEYRPPSNQWLNNPYFINSIITSANIASTIIENNKASDFFYRFQDKITDMWYALTKHDKVLSKTLLTDSLVWAVENNIITIQQLDGIYGQF